MQHIEIPSNDARLSRQPQGGEAVVITRYGKPELVVLRWEDFMPLESLIDQVEKLDMDDVRKQLAAHNH